jgi:hypothetical protein
VHFPIDKPSAWVYYLFMSNNTGAEFATIKGITYTVVATVADVMRAQGRVRQLGLKRERGSVVYSVSEYTNLRGVVSYGPVTSLGR